MKLPLISLTVFILCITGLRFGKSNRVNETFLYRFLNTTECNQRAEYKKLGLKWIVL